jgi:phage FluMu protein Com
MPIRFRCSYCNRLLGIATRKAGTETTCPHCGYTITVPVPQEDDTRTDRVNVDEIDQILGNAATEAVTQSAVAAAPAAPAMPPSAPVAEKPPEARPAQAASVAPSAPPPKVHPSPHPTSKKATPAPAPTNPEDRPLFEKDVDDILGRSDAPEEPEREKPPPVSGMDAMNLGEPTHQIVISAQKATLLMVVVVVLMALSFVAGMLMRG